MESKKIIIDDKEEYIFVVSDDEIEDNSDLVNLEDTMDLSEVINSE